MKDFDELGRDKLSIADDSISDLSEGLKVQLLKLNISEYLDEIKKLFKDGVYVTLLVRNTHREKANVMMTDDPDAEQIVSGDFQKSCTEAL